MIRSKGLLLMRTRRAHADSIAVRESLLLRVGRLCVNGVTSAPHSSSRSSAYSNSPRAPCAGAGAALWSPRRLFCTHGRPLLAPKPGSAEGNGIMGGVHSSTGTGAGASSSGSSTGTPNGSSGSGAVRIAAMDPDPEEREYIIAKARKVTPSIASTHYKLHIRHTLPVEDDEGLILCFSQGTTEFCWREVAGGAPGAPVIKTPTLLRAETLYNRVSLFGMPKGYPITTAEGFQRFFYVSLTSSFVSSFGSAIGYQSLLGGFFAASSPQLWMLKDLVPALLAAYLANRVVSYEKRPKFWFVVSVFMNNVTVIADMLIPSMVPQHMLLAAITTSTVKQSSALMYFVTRAAALQHFATYNNLAEITKKFNSFGMVTYTIATALGIAFCTYVPSFQVQLATVVVCCVVNMYLSSQSMSPIPFRILNFTTLDILMKHYVRSGGGVYSPQEISDQLGVRMLHPPIRLDDPHDKTNILYISPPIDKLLIRTDTMDRDVLFVCANEAFMIGLWEPTAVPLSVRECWHRWELPPAVNRVARFFSLRSWLSTRAQEDPIFGNKKLVLLVHQNCTPGDLIAAHYILYTATLCFGHDVEGLRAFLRRCHRTQDKWIREAAVLRERLRDVGWDVELPAIDHADYRLSDLLIPPSMRPPRHRKASSLPPSPEPQASPS